MNQTEYFLLTKDQIYKMYEDVCKQLEYLEEELQQECDDHKETKCELQDLDDKVNELLEEIEELK